MLLHDIFLSEAVAIRDPAHMAAFAIVVAEAYDAAPQVEPAAIKLWQELARQNRDVMLRKIAADGVRVEYTPHDPYGTLTDDPAMMVRYMLWDMLVNKRLQIYSGHSDNHPVFSEEDNVIFRTVHDYFTHGRLRGMFKQQIEQMGLMNQQPTPEQLAQILPNIKLDKGGNIGHVFSLRGEINAFLTHSRLASPRIVPVLFTEVDGQACYNTVVGDFPMQKAAILQGFDYRHVGQPASPQVAQRMQEVRSQLRSEPVFDINVAAKPKIASAEIQAKVSR